MNYFSTKDLKETLYLIVLSLQTLVEMHHFPKGAVR
jgi:hypothetical protein